eukprot:9615295-Alexandrium_andersonii.AAC.1
MANGRQDKARGRARRGPVTRCSSQPCPSTRSPATALAATSASSAAMVWAGPRTLADASSTKVGATHP